ncbi:MAG: nitroreductase family protein [Erysipelotrichaceae bacterium]|nr:nitroreductase family protein [Erysipelotrichaceae bacterium]
MYETIYKRKSFHLFRNTGDEKISEDELNDIYEIYEKLNPLYPEIKTSIRIVKDDNNCKRGQEYCVLFYSEKKDGYLQNIGYFGEQLELNLVSKNIGTLWFGIGKVEEECFNGLDFVIMMAIKKIDDESKFRKDMFKSKRKELSEIWKGELIPGLSEIVRFAPSACNSQPWYVENDDDVLRVYRYKKEGKRGIMPALKVDYYNQIDIGIFLCFIYLCLKKIDIRYERINFNDKKLSEELFLNAEYKLLS